MTNKNIDDLLWRIGNIESAINHAEESLSMIREQARQISIEVTSLVVVSDDE